MPQPAPPGFWAEPTPADARKGKPGRTLRPYQVDALHAVHGAFMQGVPSTLVVLPTGAGKTILFSHLGRDWDHGNVLVLAHRIELLDQAADKLAPELGYRPVVEQADRGADPALLWQGGQVIVGSVQTFCSDKRLRKYEDHPFGLIVVDECHRATSPSYRKVIDFFAALNPAMKLVGVTATPNRTDGKALGLVFNHVAYHMPVLTAVEGGWLVPVRQEYVVVENLDFSKIGTTKNELNEKDFDKEQLETILIEEEHLHAMTTPILERGRDRQGIIFTAGVAHAHLLADVLNRHRDGCAAAVDGKTDWSDRQNRVRDFREGRLQFLVNFGIFTEGFDVPPASLVVMGRPTKSELLYRQMLGRVMRPLDGVADGPPDAAARRAAIAASAKPDCLALDFVGVSRFGLADCVDVLGGDYGHDVRELARERLKREGGGDVAEELKKARADMMLRQEQERRKNIKAEVSYRTFEVDPFSTAAGPGEGSVEKTRGGATDAQIGFLVNLGVEYATAAAYGRRQASAVIDDLRQKRCTKKQATTLKKYDYDPQEFNVDSASAMIDEIAKNGWRRPEEVAG